MATLKRASFGHSVSLGTLYDARTDMFLNKTLVSGEIPRDAIVTTATKRDQTLISTNDSFKERFDKYDLNNETTTGFLAGMIVPQGSARYLLQKQSPSHVVHRTLQRLVTTFQYTINFSSPSLTSVLNFSSLEESIATHVVAGATFGARTIISANLPLPAGADRTTYELEMDEVFRDFERQGDPLSPNTFELTSRDGGNLNIRVYSDFPDIDDGSSSSLEEAFGHFRGVEKRIEAEHSAIGQPLAYVLLPVQFLTTFGAVVPDQENVNQLSPEFTKKYIDLLDEFIAAQQSLTGHYKKLRTHSSIVRAEHIRDVEAKLMLAQMKVDELTTAFARLLPAIRSGKSSGSEIWRLVEDALASDAAPTKLLSMMDEYAGKLEFIATAVDLGATYLLVTGRTDRFVRAHISEMGMSYVLFFSGDVINGDEDWAKHFDSFKQLLTESSRSDSIILADCTLSEDVLSRATISCFSNGELKTRDMLKHKDVVAQKHVIRFLASELEGIDIIPAQRRAVTLPCPHSDCDPLVNCDWVCFECLASMEFSPTDEYLYCECGKIPVEVARFNCQRPGHGSKYAMYPPGKLRRLLRTLPPPPELNILILGETGVGKSTFINAFVNYLTFSTLDEAMEAPRLNSVIPCSFTTQVVDHATGRLISQEVTIGSDINESDLRGASATQQATVYPLYIGGTLVRLIDTPGIGDTRGIDQDKANMENILSVLRNYSSLHGILILLKPNNARLNVMFRFCVKELLSSLHRSAAQNIAFGFTNTRGSDYKPGDTFGPLARLLSDYDDVIPGLFEHNVYCYDSESFRYLAAHKQGIDMGTIEDYKRSWDQSTKETGRLLTYFRSLIPHHVQETLSLNETRHLISQLVEPMQQISGAVTDSIAKSEQQVQELSDLELTGKELMTKLKIQKTVVQATKLTQPKTVCSNENCVTPCYDKASGGTVLLRKSLCHNPCYLTEVPVQQVGTQKLAGCAAFAGSQTCTKCKHDWREHEHIMVEYSSTSEKMVDPRVQAELKTNGNLTKAKEAQIKALRTQVSELKDEHKFIQEAAAKFSIYMKTNSITHYNDATIDYLDHLIKDERSKVRAGENKARLERLERDKAQYETYVAAMESGKIMSSKKSGVKLDERGVAQLVQELYGLKHYGQMLKEVSNVVRKAYAANFRERPYRIRRKQMSVDYSGSRFDQKHAPQMAPRRTLRSSVFDERDDNPIRMTANDVSFQRVTSNMRKAGSGKPKGRSFRFPGLSNGMSRSSEKESVPSVGGVLDWIDEGRTDTIRSAFSNKGFLDEKSATLITSGRSGQDHGVGPPSYTEATDGDGPINFGNSAQRPNLWSKVRGKFFKF